MSRRFRPLLEWTIPLMVLALLYLSGWHTEVIGRVQQVFLKTGIFSPSKVLSELQSPVDPALLLRDNEGEISSISEFQGKVVFINFWASWCPPCVAEMPDIEELYNDYKGKDVIFLMINLDDDLDKMERFMERKAFTFPIYRLASAVPTVFESRSIPTTYVVSRDGLIVLKQSGMASYNTISFRNWLDELIEEI
jgi:thiol-disulfide isomerase/thioredoxin